MVHDRDHLLQLRFSVLRIRRYPYAFVALKLPAHQSPYPSVSTDRSVFNTDLVSWNDNHVSNMANDIHTKMQHQELDISKQNATFWVHGSDIGGIAMRTRILV